MRIVLDTNVLIRAHERSRSLARRLLESLIAGRHTLLLSNEMLSEVTKVLRYPRFQDLYDLTEGELYEYTQLLRSISDSVALGLAPVSNLTPPAEPCSNQTARAS